MKDFVQILNVNRNHWITISIVGAEPNSINVYDSLNCYFNDKALRSFAYMARNFIDGSVLMVARKAVQQQRGGNDCGPMAVAFAYTLCSGGDPSKVRYYQKILRQEIVLSFVEGTSLFLRPVQKKLKENTAWSWYATEDWITWGKLTMKEKLWYYVTAASHGFISAVKKSPI